MKIAPFLLILVLVSCNSATKTSTTSDSAISVKQITSAPINGELVFKNEEDEGGQSSGMIKVGEIICFVTGKFSNSEKTDTAYVIKTKQGEGNPVEDGTPDEYALRFTGSDKSVNIGCCDARLVNEGDLNGDRKEEVSIFQYPMNGNTCCFSTYTNKRGTWKEMIEPFLIPTGGDAIADSELQDAVIKTDNIVYYSDYSYATDNNVIKVRAVLK